MTDLPTFWRVGLNSGLLVPLCMKRLSSANSSSNRLFETLSSSQTCFHLEGRKVESISRIFLPSVREIPVHAYFSGRFDPHDNLVLGKILEMDVGRRRDVIGAKDMSNAYQYRFAFLSTTYVVFSLLMQTVCK